MKEFIHELAITYPWSHVDELIYKINPITSTIVSLKCCTIQPDFTFEAREYMSIDDIGDILYSTYSKTCQDPPYSEKEIIAYEDKYNVKLPSIARIFSTRVSKSLIDINKSPHHACISADDDFIYGVCEFEECRIYYNEDKDDNKQTNSIVIDICHDKNPWLIMVIEGVHKGRVFDSSCSSGLTRTKNELDFFLNTNYMNFPLN